MKDALDGRWKVTVTGFTRWRIFNLLGDHKVIAGNIGYNQVVTGRIGYFRVSHNSDGAVLDYAVGANDEPLIYITDIIYPDGKGGWVGKFYYDNELIFNFRMDRVEDRE